MPKFEVSRDEKHSFLSRLKISLKTVALSNSCNVQKRLNKNWDIERKLFHDITSSTNRAKAKELRYLLHQIVKRASNDPDITPEAASSLIAILVERTSALLSRAKRNEQRTEHIELYAFFTGGSFLSVDEFSCQSCCELLYNPITLQCGHSFCQICVLQNSLKTCVVCRKSYQEPIKEYKINICLTNILQRWHSVEWFGRSLIVDGLLKLNKEEYQESVNIFSQALDMIPNSHIATLHRAKAYYLLNKFDQALEDSIKACILAQKWPETYYVKGEILFKLHCFEQSLLAHLICLVLDPHNTFAKERIHEIVTKLVGSVSEDLAEAMHKNLSRTSSEKSALSTLKRRMSEDGGSDSKPKVGRQDFDDCNTTCSTTLTIDSVVTSTSSSSDPASLRLTKSDTDVFQIDTDDPNAMKKSNTHVLLTFELSYDKKRDQILFSDGSGVFRSVASELGRTLDSVLFEIDNSVTGDLRTLQNSTFDRELLEAVNLNFPPNPRAVDTTVIDANDFECSLCMRLLYDPVCTPCGHTFCQLCIERCLDHNASCPLCKCSMEKFLAENVKKRHPTCDYVTKSIIQQYVPDAYKERLEQHKVEMDELLEREPIFVCTIAFPSVPCPLHIFEPRYRLMLRRCLEHNDKEFGMCMPDKDQTHHPIGTLLKVRDVTFFSDGRSVVDSIGCRRFKTSNFQVKDGYNTAKITFIVDVRSSNSQSVDTLSRRVYAEAKTWFNNLDDNVRDRINKHFGEFPDKDESAQSENGPDWHWWVLAILPVEDRVKATILGKNVLHERLLIIHRIFTCLQQRNKKR